jgi:hypothetical protein
LSAVRKGAATGDRLAGVLVQRVPQFVAHFLLTAISHVAYPTGEQRRVAVLLADQVAVAQ